MTSTAKVTFIIPAYNAEKYLPEAIKSVQAQTCPDWKMIIVDDSSSDHTLQIAEEFASDDERISVIRMERQSGGAYLPRKVAIKNATTPLVSPLDADDTISPDYLEELLKIMDNEDADAVYPMMYTLREGEYEYTATPDISLIGKTLTGKEAMDATLDGWRIHCNGGIIKKNVYIKAFQLINEDEIEVKSYLDEYLTRILLFTCSKVAITNEKYIFRENFNSITHSQDIKAFGFIGNNIRLLSFAKENLPRESETYLRIHKQNFHGIADAMRLLYNTRLCRLERKKVIDALKNSRNAIDYNVLKGKISIRYRALISLPFSISIPLIRLIDSIRS
ncbi:MAG: glycosyltransferase family 2 protein [Muribaculaceae bacterium]|nr:glycosyltransferase family 2 protein [Muribaculaceae bacterium]